jgi:hypothetical protein
MPTAPPGEPPPKGDLLSQTKGLFQSLSEGIRNLLILDEKLGGIGRENERARSEIAKLQKITYRLIGKVEEMEKRFAERFNELDKRLTEVDKRIDLKVELAVRNEITRSFESELAKPRRKAVRSTAPSHTE